VSCTLDAYNLDLEAEVFAERVDAAGVEWDDWESGAYVRKYRTYGRVRTWRLKVHEDAVAIPWINSAAYHLQGHVEDGAQLTYILNYLGHTANTLVYVKSVDVYYTQGTDDRFFDLTVQEV